jgi:hypothetical protein
MSTYYFHVTHILINDREFVGRRYEKVTVVVAWVREGRSASLIGRSSEGWKEGRGDVCACMSGIFSHHITNLTV